MVEVKANNVTAIGSIVKSVKRGSSAIVKVTRLASKTLGENLDFVKFMSAKAEDFDKLIPSRFRDKSAIEKVIDKLDGEVLLDVDAQRLRLSAITEELVESDIEDKTKWLNRFKDGMTDEEQVHAANQMKLYKASLLVAVRNASVYKKLYGIEG
jgi:hypothetical protein